MIVNKQREALQAALDALTDFDYDKRLSAIDMIKQALAEPESLRKCRRCDAYKTQVDHFASQLLYYRDREHAYHQVFVELDSEREMNEILTNELARLTEQKTTVANND